MIDVAWSLDCGVVHSPKDEHESVGGEITESSCLLYDLGISTEWQTIYLDMTLRSV